MVVWPNDLALSIEVEDNLDFIGFKIRALTGNTECVKRDYLFVILIAVVFARNVQILFASTAASK